MFCTSAETECYKCWPQNEIIRQNYPAITYISTKNVTTVANWYMTSVYYILYILLLVLMAILDLTVSYDAKIS